MQVVQATEDSFTVYMPVSGVRIDAFHCDARAMTNVIPTVNYCKWLFVILLHTTYTNFIHSNDWYTNTQNILRKFFLLIIYNITTHNCMVALIYFDSPYNVLPNVRIMGVPDNCRVPLGNHEASQCFTDGHMVHLRYCAQTVGYTHSNAGFWGWRVRSNATSVLVQRRPSD